MMGHWTLPVHRNGSGWKISQALARYTTKGPGLFFFNSKVGYKRRKATKHRQDPVIGLVIGLLSWDAGYLGLSAY